MSSAVLPDIRMVRHWLAQVPDPEIPVISLTDLGIIRDVQWQDDTLVVTVTPTYSGCPATSVINLDIEAALRARGIQKLRLERQLSPPWTTDWITPEGREKLRAYGIAPPVDGTAADGRLAGRIARPLRIDQDGKDQPVRLDPLQGQLPLHRLPGTLRLFQMHLRMRPMLRHSGRT